MFSKSKRVVGVHKAGMMLAAVFAGCDGSTGGTSSAGDSGTSSGGSATQIDVTVDEMMADARIAHGRQGQRYTEGLVAAGRIGSFKKQCDNIKKILKSRAGPLRLK